MVFEQFTYVPLEHTCKKIIKLFTSYFSIYKSYAHLKQDLMQPFLGIGHLYIGLTKILWGLVAWNGLILMDGLLTFIRGVLELAMAPLTWTMKPLIRSIATLLCQPRLIESNPGLQRVVQYGLNYLEDELITSLLEGHDLPPVDIYQLSAITTDIHRKYRKALNRQQSTIIEEKEEQRLYDLTKQKPLSRQNLSQYFALFRASSSQPNQPFSLETQPG